MVALRVNAAAAGLLGGVSADVGLAPGLCDLLAAGIERRGPVLVWAGRGADVAADAAGLGRFGDLTGWECAESSLHLEDHVAVPVAVVDGAPVLAEGAQLVLLRHGIVFAERLRAVVGRLDGVGVLRCVISVNETNGTFRFHQVRPGESWLADDLDRYQDKVVVVDVTAAGRAR